MSTSYWITVLAGLAIVMLMILWSLYKMRKPNPYAGTPLRDSEFHVSRACFLILIPGVAFFEFCGLYILYTGKPDWGTVVFAAPCLLLGLVIGVYGLMDILMTMVIIRGHTLVYRRLWKWRMIDLAEMKSVSVCNGDIVIDTGVAPRTLITMQLARSRELLAMLEWHLITAIA
jgi:hypothetical protein